MRTDAVQSRIEREREFHNKEFAASERAKISGFYLVTRSSTKWYEDFLRQHAPGSHLLEYGCGPNSYAFTLAAQGARVVGIDISDTAIELSVYSSILFSARISNFGPALITCVMPSSSGKKR